MPGDTWGRGSSAPREIRSREQHIEQAVTDHIGRMEVLWVRAEDESGTQSVRAYVERNAVALLSRTGAGGETADCASTGWLGNWCPNEAVRRSALWNVQHVHGDYDPRLLQVLDELVGHTEPP